MALNTTQLRQDRAKIVEQMRALQDGMVERHCETPEESEKFAKMETDIRALEKVIEREETLEKHEADLAKTIDEKRKSGLGDKFDGIRYPIDGVRMPTKEELERRTAFLVQG